MGPTGVGYTLHAIGQSCVEAPSVRVDGNKEFEGLNQILLFSVAC